MSSNHVGDVGDRLRDLEEVIVALASFNYSKKAQVSPHGDTIDSMAVGLNMLGEELAASTVSKGYVTHILHSMIDPVVVTDRGGVLRMVNQATCTMSGFTREELLGQHFIALLPELNTDDVIASGRATHPDTYFASKHSEPTPVSVTASIMLDRGEVQGIVCVARDLTEVKRAEEERLRLRGAMKLQAALMEELSTPLIPIADDVLALPLIGSLDEDRTVRMTETLLQGVISRAARVVIVDFTGLRAFDQASVHGLLRAIGAVRLIGADVVITGIQPRVAQTMVQLDADLSGIVIFGAFQQAIPYALDDRRRERR
ncbi:PAS domain S-box protein [Pendulispora rubella]|uniref:PAS domain S-box protein n=1 Tax=Pendulispora rubella TaxID=2741070 RepID=A0ABZ2KQI5_9BACT